MHAAVIFGWSSISQIIKENDFFLSQNTLARRSSRAVSESNNSNSTASESCFAVSEEEGTQSKEHESQKKIPSAHGYNLERLRPG